MLPLGKLLEKEWVQTPIQIYDTTPVRPSPLPLSLFLVATSTSGPTVCPRSAKITPAGAEFDGRIGAWGASGGSSILPAPTKQDFALFHRRHFFIIKVMKREYFGVLIVLAVIGFFWFGVMGRKQTSEEPSVAPSVNENIIIYTNSGYSPSEFLVQTGTTVVFVNQSGLPMWTATDPHPIHTDYAEFDQRRGVDRGETYEFTFEEPGTYDYHNHLSPQHAGTIIVE